MENNQQNSQDKIYSKPHVKLKIFQEGTGSKNSSQLSSNNTYYQEEN